MYYKYAQQRDEAHSTEASLLKQCLLWARFRQSTAQTLITVETILFLQQRAAFVLARSQHVRQGA